MLTTAEGDGTLRSRPMATQRTKFDGTLWFFTKESSHKVDEIRQDRHVNVSYGDPDQQNYVSISGTARLVRDRAKIKELWNPAYKAWFPKGVDDPEVALLKVEVTEAEYWDAPSSTMAHLFGVVKASITGKPAKVGENKKVEVKPAAKGKAGDRGGSPAGEPMVRRRSGAGR